MLVQHHHGKPSFNLLRASISTICIYMKCLLLSGCISVIQGDQKAVMRCYEDSLSVRRVNVYVVISLQLDDNGVNFVIFTKGYNLTEK